MNEWFFEHPLVFAAMALAGAVVWMVNKWNQWKARDEEQLEASRKRRNENKR